MAEFDVEFISDDEAPDFIALSDDKGNEDQFLIVGCVKVDSTFYVLAVPVSPETVEDAEEDLVYVFAVRQEGEAEYFEYIRDEDVITAVFERYDALYREQVGDDD
jgi:uncharacterized protein YrzB (UPF0473 family)